MILNRTMKVAAILALLTVVLASTPSLFQPNATAQTKSTTDSNSRYGVSAWAYPGVRTPNSSIEAKYGAYIIDSATGEIWLVEGNSKPQIIGGVR